ncbi:C1 family peptidase [Blautia obeum]|uniref:Papain family cysteine protease n=1 Tax=Blautia obeum TaxID=40520 RepID=A0A564TFC2_9FIRM|nr:C1 family peptidase [Blautia obeum]VUX05944.1 Papain family cysteine protease [Blautia obeum]
MIHHKQHGKKRTLALLLAGSVLFTNIPVSANAVSDVELSADESASGETDNTGNTATNDAVDISIDSIDENTASATVEDSSELQSVASDDSTSSDDFSSDDDEAVFSSGAESPNSENIDYILGRPMTDEERQAQLAPLQNLDAFAPEPEVDSNIDIATYALYPGTYNANEEGFVTDVKNQRNTSLCWAFSLASNLETSLLTRGQKYYDLSEEQLAYFWANRVNDPLGNTPNDKITRTQSNYHGTGNGRVASFFLSTWSGMTTEEKVPFQSSAVTWPDSLAYDTSAYMEDAIFSQYTVERTKQLLMEYNSVSAMIYMLDNYYYPDTASYSCPQSGLVNHAVTIVGWDDTYSKENFPSASGVKNDGAWIVKNSYGKNWGKNGYFYLSYEDQSITNLVSNTASTSEEYNNNYFYDGAAAGTVTFPSKTINNGYYVSNIFKATAGNGKDEELGEIVTAIPQDNTDFQIQVYTDLKNTSDPTSGTPAYAEPVDYTQPLAGIHTIHLNTPVKIPQGTFYSVVIRIPDGSNKFYVEKTTTSTSWFTATAGIDPDQSFFSTSGKKWYDAGNQYNCCFSVKAHTKTLDSSTVVTPSVEPTPDAKPTVNPEVQPSVSPDPTPEEKPSVTPEVTPKAVPTSTPTPTPPSSARVNTCFRVGNLKYRVTANQVVTCYGTTNSRVTKISIPSTVRYNGVTYRVTSIWANAFKKKSRLTTVSIGHNVSVIGKNAFYKCKKLKKVTIGAGLTQINPGAFRGVKKGCTITIKSLKLKRVSSRIDQSVSRMTVRVPKRKYTAYKKLLRKKSKTVIIKKY